MCCLLNTWSMVLVLGVICVSRVTTAGKGIPIRLYSNRSCAMSHIVFSNLAWKQLAKAQACKTLLQHKLRDVACRSCAQTAANGSSRRAEL